MSMHNYANAGPNRAALAALIEPEAKQPVAEPSVPVAAYEALLGRVEAIERLLAGVNEASSRLFVQAMQQKAQRQNLLAAQQFQTDAGTKDRETVELAYQHHPIIERILSLEPGASYVLSNCVRACMTAKNAAWLAKGLREIDANPAFKRAPKTGDSDKWTRVA